MSLHQTIQSLFHSAVRSVISHISDFVLRPGKDFTRNRKFTAAQIISFLITMGASSTRVEMLDFFGMDALMPTSSAFRQQRAKLRPEALSEIFHTFNTAYFSLGTVKKTIASGYRCIAADGSTTSFFSSDKFHTEDYFVSEGPSAKGFYSLHINALYDLDRNMYVASLLQPVHKKDEFLAFCTMVDTCPVLSDRKDIYIGDRGYCSYNNMAHIIEKEQYFLFRTKDVLSKGLVGNFKLPKEGMFDETVTVTLVRSHSRKIRIPDGNYRRFVDRAASFDFLEYGSDGTYPLSFRVVRFQLPDGSFECLVTNLPEDEFPPARLRDIYNARWGIESSFRKLKYTIGMSNFHSCKPEHVEQEIWAKLIAYNITEAMIQSVILETHDTKHAYKVNFSMAVHICRVFLRLAAEEDVIDTVALLRKELLPIRPGRAYPRLKTAHFRRPKYFVYRAA
ncbi:IS4 family transposase [Clostridium transplantifaecale]|uniref:IS4 family transposase n=1 Tax=Clostridium transplantifaecale TaxID=2479838 RepID=UPI000F634437|nr:IS4 family transposase [Clostridium transplantifaecale]